MSPEEERTPMQKADAEIKKLPYHRRLDPFQTFPEDWEEDASLLTQEIKQRRLQAQKVYREGRNAILVRYGVVAEYQDRLRLLLKRHGTEVEAIKQEILELDQLRGNEV